jgi:hypothetical protein
VYSLGEPTSQRISTGRPSQPQRQPGSMHEGLPLGCAFPRRDMPRITVNALPKPGRARHCVKGDITPTDTSVHPQGVPHVFLYFTLDV